MYNDGRGIIRWQKRLEGNFLGWKKNRMGNRTVWENYGRGIVQGGNCLIFSIRGVDNILTLGRRSLLR